MFVHESQPSLGYKKERKEAPRSCTKYYYYGEVLLMTFLGRGKSYRWSAVIGLVMHIIVKTQSSIISFHHEPTSSLSG